MKRGQITVYCALSFSLILSLFLSVMESARAAGLRLYMECAMESALNSAFAEYNRELLDKYDVFFLDLSYNGVPPAAEEASGRITEYMMRNLSPEEGEHLLSVTDWYDVTGVHAEVKGMRLSTDGHGDVFRNQAVHYIKQFIGLDELENVQNWIQIKEEKEIDGEAFEKTAEAVRAEWDSYQAEGIWAKEDSKLLLPDNYFFSVDAISLLVSMKEHMHISNAKADLSKVLSHRQNAEGSKGMENDSLDLTEELFFNEYIFRKFGNFMEPMENTAMQYEMEYILRGFENDRKNFDAVMDELYLFRCAADFCVLCMDEENTQAVREFAKAVSAATKVPEQVITAFIFVLWAEAEAATDLRSLLDGKKVPLLKDVKEFNIGLNGKKNVSSEEGKETEQGLSYEDYLRIFLCFVPPDVKVYRTMDLIELNIRKWTGNERFRMDACLDGIVVSFSLESGFGYCYTAERDYYYNQ